jgi:hypothetical protein
VSNARAHGHKFLGGACTLTLVHPDYLECHTCGRKGDLPHDENARIIHQFLFGNLNAGTYRALRELMEGKDK